MEDKDLRETFLSERPETSDVVLCLHSGETLQDIEHDVFWKDTINHPYTCVPFYIAKHGWDTYCLHVIEKEKQEA